MGGPADRLLGCPDTRASGHAEELGAKQSNTEKGKLVREKKSEMDRKKGKWLAWGGASSEQATSASIPGAMPGCGSSGQTLSVPFCGAADGGSWSARGISSFRLTIHIIDGSMSA